MPEIFFIVNIYLIAFIKSGNFLLNIFEIYKFFYLQFGINKYIKDIFVYIRLSSFYADNLYSKTDKKNTTHCIGF